MDSLTSIDGQPVSRILIYGVTGSGKTTLAARLSRVTGIPWHSVDDLTWDPGWITVPVEIQKERIQAIVSQPEWILDTAYGSWRDIPMARAELIVALDYPRVLSFWRLLRRSILRAVDKKPICNGNVETFRGMFSKESILLWHFKSFKSKQSRIADWSARSDGPRVVRIRRPKELEDWIASLGASWPLRGRGAP